MYNVLDFVLRYLVTPVFAQSDPPKIDDLIKAENVDRILGYIMSAGGLIAVTVLIIGGYTWIMSGGDPAKKQQAQGTLTWAVIGLIFLVMTYAIIEFVIGLIE